jgi:transcriptional antiterminator RfaH
VKQWYAVHCKPKQDERAETELLNQGFEVFRPRLRSRRRVRQRYRVVVESMFPRYLFVHLDDHEEDWSPIRSTRGVTGLVRMGGVAPVVPAAVIEALQRAGRCGQLHRSAAGRRLRAKRSRADHRGPLAGFEALFSARNSQERVVVLLNLMKVTLPVHAITRA